MKQFINKVKNNFTNRFVYLIVFFIVIMVFGIFTKKVSYVKNYGQEEKFLLNNQTLVQEIQLENKNVYELKIKVGKNEPISGANYKISVFDGEKNVGYANVDTKSLKSEQDILISISNSQVQSDSLRIEIVGMTENEDDGLYIYTIDDTNQLLSINDTTQNFALKYAIGYTQYTFIYNFCFTLLAVFGILFILLIDIKKIHNCAFATIMIAGIFLCVLNPILDTPDDHAHICRAELTSRGILFITGNTEDYNISNSLGSIIKDNFSPFNYSNVYNEKMDFNYDSSYPNYANTNLFIGYIPQALAILTAKLLGKIFGLNAIFIVIFGRLFNLAFYASIVRVAIRKASIFKVPLSIVAMSPMALFIAASFNPDATTYALVFLLIGYILQLYKKENIEIKDIVIYSILCVLIGLVKLPYCIIGGLIVFLPKSKFKDKKTYYKSFLFVVAIAIVCVGWGCFAIISSSAESPFKQYYIDNNIDTAKQIKSILDSPARFVGDFSVGLVTNLKEYIEQLGTFGWLSYSENPAILMLYPIFIGSMIIFYPNEEIITKKTKYGISIISFGIYAITCFILFLTWTPVGSAGISGVQGRYFVPLIGLLMLLSSGRGSNDEKEKIDYTFLVLAMSFIAVLIITMLNKYY